jgi:hypothetical protein
VASVYIWANAKILPDHEHALWNMSHAWTTINISYSSWPSTKKGVNCAIWDSSGVTRSKRLCKGLHSTVFGRGPAITAKGHVYPMVIINWPPKSIKTTLIASSVLRLFGWLYGRVLVQKPI